MFAFRHDRTRKGNVRTLTTVRLYVRHENIIYTNLPKSACQVIHHLHVW